MTPCINPYSEPSTLAVCNCQQPRDMWREVLDDSIAEVHKNFGLSTTIERSARKDDLQADADGATFTLGCTCTDPEIFALALIALGKAIQKKF